MAKSSVMPPERCLATRGAEHQPDQFDFGWLRVGRSIHDPGHSALPHDEDPVRQTYQLEKLVSDQDDPDPCGRQPSKNAVDFLLGAGVDAARRIVEDQNPDRTAQPARQHHLLLVAAGQLSAKSTWAARLEYRGR